MLFRSAIVERAWDAMRDRTHVPDGVYFVCPDGGTWTMIMYSGGKITDLVKKPFVGVRSDCWEYWLAKYDADDDDAWEDVEDYAVRAVLAVISGGPECVTVEQYMGQ